ncbi:MAG: DUF4386 domain-containing protein [Chloroflexi bacterium]|nr:DUF4386 domain-containing protein [Chloroflexota bacterium]
MSSDRKTAIIVGVLFIAATVMSILGTLVFIGPILDDPDYLTNVSAKENQLLIGVLFELIAAAAVAGTAIALFPIFKKHNEALALGYVGGRIIEGVFIIVSAVSALLLLTLSKEYIAGAPDASHFQTLGAVLQADRVWTFLLGPNVLFSLNALMVSYLLYQSRLVPRFLSVWGLIGAPLVLAAGLIRVFGLVTLFSPIAGLLAGPIALFEMVLAVWLIVKGFNSSAIASESART